MTNKIDVHATIGRINTAAEILEKIVQEWPRSTTLPIVLEQIRHLQETYARDKNFLAIPKNKMTFGRIVAREGYADRYPKLAEVLHKISYDLDHQND